MLIGTYRDMMSDEDLKEKNKLLHTKLKSTDFFKKDFIKYVSRDNPILDVNNYDGGKEDRDRFRCQLKKVIDECFAKIEIPATWLMLSLYIRMEVPRIVTLIELEEIAGELQIDPDELQIALWVFHHIMGIFLYYPSLEALKDVVICDVKVIYDSITELIKNTFSIDNIGQAAADIFRDKAKFSEDDLQKAVRKADYPESLLPLKKLVILLEYLNIMICLTPMPSEKTATTTTEYFMPSILRGVKAEKLNICSCFSDPAALLLCYECGYIPLGLFSAMITNIISLIISLKLKDWDLNENTMHRNKIVFRVGTDNDIVTLISRPKYIKIIVSRECDSIFSRLLWKVKSILPRTSHTQTPTCVQVRKVVTSSLAEVASRMNYKIDLKPSLAFNCPCRRGSDHICMLDSESDTHVKCQSRLTRIPLSTRQRAWFDDPDAISSEYKCS